MKRNSIVKIETGIVLAILSIFFVHCSHAPKMADMKDAPESCKPKEQVLDIEKGKSSQNPLMKAVFEGDVKKLKELISTGHDVHGKDALGLSYLHLAAAMGNSEMVDILIKAGIPVNLKMGKKGSTPAHSAVSWGKASSLQALLKNGADLSIPNSEGKTPESLAVELKKEEVLDFFKQQKKL